MCIYLYVILDIYIKNVNFIYFQAQAALMYDALFVLADAFTKLLKKKPDQFRTASLKRGSQTPTNLSSNVNNNNISPNTNSNSNGGGNNNHNSNGNKALDCSKGTVIEWEHGDKISKYMRKVSRAALCYIV